MMQAQSIWGGGELPPPTFVAQQIIEVKIRKWTV